MFVTAATLLHHHTPPPLAKCINLPPPLFLVLLSAGCRMYNLPVDVRMIRLDKGQHKEQEYLSINPLGKASMRGQTAPPHTVVASLAGPWGASLSK